MVVGTQNGAIKVFGAPGVEFYSEKFAQNTNNTDCSIQLLEWLPGSGRFLSLSAQNTLTLWEPAGSILLPLKNFSLERKSKKVSAICACIDKTRFWVATELGKIFEFTIDCFNDSTVILTTDMFIKR